MIRTFVRFSSRSAPSSGPPTGPPARVRAMGSAGALGAAGASGAPNEIGAPKEIGADASAGPPFAAAPPSRPPKSIENPANGSGSRGRLGRLLAGRRRRLVVRSRGPGGIVSHRIILARWRILPPGIASRPRGSRGQFDRRTGSRPTIGDPRARPARSRRTLDRRTGPRHARAAEALRLAAGPGRAGPVGADRRRLRLPRPERRGQDDDDASPHRPHPSRTRARSRSWAGRSGGAIATACSRSGR